MGELKFKEGDWGRSSHNEKYRFKVLEVDVMGRPCKVQREGSNETQVGWWEGVAYMPA